MPDIDIDLIRRSPYQPRLYFEREDLKRSIKQDGMLVSILVREKADENTKYEIIDGERRWLVAQDLGWGKVPIELRNVDDETARRMVYTLNEERQPYTLEENTKFFRRMYGQMGTVYAIAKEFKKPASTIWNYINVSILPEHFQKAVWGGSIPMNAIKEMEPIFTEARDEIEDISSPVNYEKSPSYQKILALCQQYYMEQIKSPKELREHYVDPYLEQLDKARIQRAKDEVEKAAPTDLGEATVKMETSEDYVRAAELLMKEAERRKTPEQKAEEERKKLVAEARKSLNSTAKKIDRASQVMDVGKFHERLSIIEQGLEKDPTEARTQLVALGEEVTEAEKSAKAEAQARREEEKRQRIEAEARKKVWQEALNEPEFLKIAVGKAETVLPAEEVRRAVDYPTSLSDKHLSEIFRASPETWNDLVIAAEKRGWTPVELTAVVDIIKDEGAPDEYKAQLLQGEADPVVSKEGQPAVLKDTLGRRFVQELAQSPVVALTEAWDALSKLEQFNCKEVIDVLETFYLERVVKDTPRDVKYLNELTNLARERLELYKEVDE